MPVTLLYGRERAQVARLVLSLLRTVRNAYTPKLTLEQASEFRRVLLEHINNIQHAAKELSKMDIPPRH